MDHILENNDNPVPDPASQGAASGAGTTAPSGMDLDDEDEDDAAAIRAALGKSSANIAPTGSGADVSSSAAAEGGVAKVSCYTCSLHPDPSKRFTTPEHYPDHTCYSRSNAWSVARYLRTLILRTFTPRNLDMISLKNQQKR